jgi:hypothetical protein
MAMGRGGVGRADLPWHAVSLVRRRAGLCDARAIGASSARRERRRHAGRARPVVSGGTRPYWGKLGPWWAAAPGSGQARPAQRRAAPEHASPWSGGGGTSTGAQRALSMGREAHERDVPARSARACRSIYHTCLGMHSAQEQAHRNRHQQVIVDEVTCLSPIHAVISLKSSGMMLTGKKQLTPWLVMSCATSFEYDAEVAFACLLAMY